MQSANGREESLRAWLEAQEAIRSLRPHMVIIVQPDRSELRD